VSTSGGSVDPLAPVVTHELWVEDDQLVFEGGGDGLKLFTLPFTGGTPTLLFDGGAGRSQPGIGQFHAFTSTDFFWGEADRAGGTYGQSTVWRAARPNGVPVLVGSATARTPDGIVEGFSAMALGTDAVLMAAGFGIAVAVPFDGRPTRPLATEPFLSRNKPTSRLGIDSTGIYWSVQKPGTTYEDDSSIIVLAPADGSPVRTFWEGLPDHSAPVGIWPAEDGGWVVIAWQKFDDQRDHATIWLLDSNGQGRRLACSPAPRGSFAPLVRVRPVVTPDSVYVVAGGDISEIVRASR
jgi:hypothetical protein